MMKNIPTFEDFVNEQLNESINTKYWADYNDAPGLKWQPKWQSEKSKDFKSTFSRAVTTWNDESEDGKIGKKSEKTIENLAKRFFDKEGYISFNIIQAMIMQEGMDESLKVNEGDDVYIVFGDEDPSMATHLEDVIDDFKLMGNKLSDKEIKKARNLKIGDSTYLDGDKITRVNEL